MSYKNPAISTNKIIYDQDIEVDDGYSTIISGPITVPNVDINSGTLTIVGDITVTGNLTLTDSTPDDLNDLKTDILDPLGFANSQHRFGTAISASNSYFIVSTEFDDPYPTKDTKIHIFRNSNNELLHTIENPNDYQLYSFSDNVITIANPSGLQNEYFGSALDINGEYAIIGAWGYDSNNASSVSNGAAFVVHTSNGAIKQSLIHTGGFGSQFGKSVAISNNYFVVGAPGETSSTGGTQAGKAYIYNLSSGSLVATIESPVNEHGFGEEVAINDTYTVIGQPNFTVTPVLIGKAHVFRTSNGQFLYTITNPNPDGLYADEDHFGWSVALNSDSFTVGAIQEDNDGKAYVYHLANGSLKYTLTNPNANTSSTGRDFFGQMVDMSESYIIVGASSEDTHSSGDNGGVAYVFSTSNGAHILTINNPDLDGGSNDTFGKSVRITEKFAFVGAPREGDPNGLYTKVGMVYVFDVNTGTRLHHYQGPITDDVFLGEFLAASDNYFISSNFIKGYGVGPYSGEVYINSIQEKLAYEANTDYIVGDSANDHFGESVDICESYSIAGAYAEEESFVYDSASELGVAYVFDNSTGQKLYTLRSPTPEANAKFGLSVSISESYAIVGSPDYDASGVYNTGIAHVFNTSDGSLLYTLNNPDSSPMSDQYGYSVYITENYAIVGAPFAGTYNASRGRAYIYNMQNGNLLHTLQSPNNSSDAFGRFVHIHGNYALVGAPYENDGDSYSGKAYLYRIDYGSLLYTFDNPKPEGTGNQNYFGWSVFLNHYMAVIGAYRSYATYIYDQYYAEVEQSLISVSSTSINYLDVTWDESSSRIVTVYNLYSGLSTPNKGYVVVGQPYYASNTTNNGIITQQLGINFGNQMNWSNDEIEYPHITSDIVRGKVLIHYKNKSDANNITAVAGTVSGTTIGYGAAVALYSTRTGTYSAAAYDSQEELTVIYFTDYSTNDVYYVTVYIDTSPYSSGTVVNSSPILVSSVLTQSTEPHISALYIPELNKHVVLYNQSNDNNVYARVGQLTRDPITNHGTMSWGSEFTVYNNSTKTNYLKYDSINSKLVRFIPYDGGNSNKPTISVGTISGNTISFDAGKTVSSTANSFNDYTHHLIHDTNANKFIIGLADVNNNHNSEYFVAEVNASATSGITISTGTTFDVANTQSALTAAHAVSGGVYIPLFKKSVLAIKSDDVASYQPRLFLYNPAYAIEGLTQLLLDMGKVYVYKYNDKSREDRVSLEHTLNSNVYQYNTGYGKSVAASNTKIYVAASTANAVNEQKGLGIVYKYDLDDITDANTAVFNTIG